MDSVRDRLCFHWFCCINVKELVIIHRVNRVIVLKKPGVYAIASLEKRRVQKAYNTTTILRDKLVPGTANLKDKYFKLKKITIFVFYWKMQISFVMSKIQV